MKHHEHCPANGNPKWEQVDECGPCDSLGRQVTLSTSHDTQCPFAGIHLDWECQECALLARVRSSIVADIVELAAHRRSCGHLWRDDCPECKTWMAFQTAASIAYGMPLSSYLK